MGCVLVMIGCAGGDDGGRVIAMDEIVYRQGRSGEPFSQLAVTPLDVQRHGSSPR